MGAGATRHVVYKDSGRAHMRLVERTVCHMSESTFRKQHDVGSGTWMCSSLGVSGWTVRGYGVLASLQKPWPKRSVAHRHSVCPPTPGPNAAKSCWPRTATWAQL